jgi:hypothetical protein
MQHDPYTHFWLIDQERERAMAARGTARLARAPRTNDLGHGTHAAAPLRRRIRSAVAIAAQHVPSSAR